MVQIIQTIKIIQIIHIYRPYRSHRSYIYHTYYTDHTRSGIADLSALQKMIEIIEWEPPVDLYKICLRRGNLKNIPQVGAQRYSQKAWSVTCTQHENKRPALKTHTHTHTESRENSTSHLNHRLGLYQLSARECVLNY